MMFKRESIKIMFDSKIKIMEDFAFFVNCIKNQNCKLGFADEFVYNYVIRENSALNSKKNNLVENSKKIIENLNINNDSEFIKALKFLLYSDCVVNKYCFGATENIDNISNWNTKQNYKTYKKCAKGIKSKIKAFLVHSKNYNILKKIYK